MDKPVIEAQSGPAPTDLVVEDIVVGDGAEAQPGAVVEVHYVGAEYAHYSAGKGLWSCRRCAPAIRPHLGLYH